MTKLPFSPDLSRRSDIPEMMDMPGSDLKRLENTLYQFSAINRMMARVRHVLKKYVLDAMRPHRRYHLIDLGAGACETDVWLLKRSRSLGLDLRVTACDHDSRVVNYALNRYGHVPGLDITERDIMTIKDSEDVDFVFANHLLHHLSDHQIIKLLKHLAGFERATLLLSDIKRTRLAYAAYFTVAPLLFRQSFAHYDGLLSIRKGFLRSELLGLARSADPQGCNLYSAEHLWPARLLLLRRPRKG